MQKTNFITDILLENIRIISYMFSVVFSGYLVTNYNADFLSLFRHPILQLLAGFFLSMSMIDFRKNTFEANLINLFVSTILFVIMLFTFKKISFLYDKEDKK